MLDPLMLAHHVLFIFISTWVCLLPFLALCLLPNPFEGKYLFIPDAIESGSAIVVDSSS